MVVPLLALCTALFFLLFLYWYPSLRKKMFYYECGLNKASYLFILGASKFPAFLTTNLVGHMEIVDLHNRNAQIFAFLSEQDSSSYQNHPFLVN